MTVTREVFEQFVLENCSISVRNDPRVERDGDYKYECFDNADGDEIAFISWKGAEATYTIHDAE